MILAALPQGPKLRDVRKITGDSPFQSASIVARLATRQSNPAEVLRRCDVFAISLTESHNYFARTA